MIVQIRPRFGPLFSLGAMLVLVTTGARGPAQETKEGKRFRSSVVELTDKASPDWLLKEAKVGAPIISDRDYTLAELPDEANGGTLLLRTSGDYNTWLKAGTLRALKDTKVYVLVRWKYIRREVMDEVALTKLERDGWKEVDGEVGTTFPDGEDWRWKMFKKDLKKGDVILQLKTLRWDNWTVLFIFK